MSRFLDSRGRIFGKVNVVDILVLLAVIALIVFAVARTQATASTPVTKDVTFRAMMQRGTVVDTLLAAHGTLKDDSGTILGKVKTVTAQPSQEEVLNPVTGKLETQASSLYQDVDVVVSVKAVGSGSSLRVGTVAISVPNKVTIVGVGLGNKPFTVPTVIWDVEASK